MFPDETSMKVTLIGTPALGVLTGLASRYLPTIGPEDDDGLVSDRAVSDIKTWWGHLLDAPKAFMGMPP